MAIVYYFKNRGQNEFDVQFTGVPPVADFVFAVDQSTNSPVQGDVILALKDFRVFVQQNNWPLI